MGWDAMRCDVMCDQHVRPSTCDIISCDVIVMYMMLMLMLMLMPTVMLLCRPPSWQSRTMEVSSWVQIHVHPQVRVRMGYGGKRTRGTHVYGSRHAQPMGLGMCVHDVYRHVCMGMCMDMRLGMCTA